MTSWVLLYGHQPGETLLAGESVFRHALRDKNLYKIIQSSPDTRGRQPAGGTPETRGGTSLRVLLIHGKRTTLEDPWATIAVATFVCRPQGHGTPTLRPRVIVPCGPPGKDLSRSCPVVIERLTFNTVNSVDFQQAIQKSFLGKQRVMAINPMRPTGAPRHKNPAFTYYTAKYL